MSIQILGGDLTNYYLFKLMEEHKINVKLEGFGHYLKQKIPKPVKFDGFKLIIAPIPFTIDGLTIYAPYSDEILHIDTFLSKADKDAVIIGGPFNINDSRLIDLTQNSSFTNLTVVPASEEIIKIAIEKSNITINSSNILVTGEGRISKQVVKILESLGANIYFNKNFIIDDTDIIINTRKDFSLSNSELDLLKDECLIIDATPTGCNIDTRYGKKIGVNIITARGLPGKSAPKSVAKYIFTTLLSEKYIK